MSSSNISADTGAPVALEFESVFAGYGREAVLHDVNGVVRAGESVALIGPNGAGKTTLIRSVLGLVPLISGRIEVLGTTPEKARSRVAYVPQAEDLDREFPVNAFEVVLMGRYRRAGWFRRPSKNDKRVAMEALQSVDLADRANDRFGVLSGGQRQRVLLAHAVAQEAELLLLDEPFNGVDTTTTEVVLDVLHALRAKGAALVLSTHDLSIAHLACSDACLINHHQFGFGPIEATVTPERMREAYGGAAVHMTDDSKIVTTS